MAEATDETAEPLDPVALLEVLLRHQVRFVVIGGIAAISHGYPLPTDGLGHRGRRSGPARRTLRLIPLA